MCIYICVCVRVFAMFFVELSDVAWNPPLYPIKTRWADPTHSFAAEGGSQI